MFGCMALALHFPYQAIERVEGGNRSVGRGNSCPNNQHSSVVVHHCFVLCLATHCFFPGTRALQIVEADSPDDNAPTDVQMSVDDAVSLMVDSDKIYCLTLALVTGLEYDSITGN
ncbi:hypothetical protein J6590_044576 [Homalodisca vitripennis]|nr:hypothetical protein J6590_044576 [Homalodisca vitripennis]